MYASRQHALKATWHTPSRSPRRWLGNGGSGAIDNGRQLHARVIWSPFPGCGGTWQRAEMAASSFGLGNIRRSVLVGRGDLSSSPLRTLDCLLRSRGH